MKELNPANIIVVALRGMSWRDFNEFEPVFIDQDNIDTQAGVKMAEKLATAIEAGQVVIVLGKGVSLA